MPELKPCPFCGGKDLAKTRHRVECFSCEASGPGYNAFGPTQNLLASWNTRAAPAQPQAVAVKVKPLVWVQISKGFSRAACVPGQQYEVLGLDDNWMTNHLSYGAGAGKVGLPSEAAARAYADELHRDFILSQITTRSVDEVRNEAIDRMEWDTQKVLADWFRRGVSGEKMQDAPSVAARNLKSQPAPAPVQDDAVQRMRKAAQAIADHDLFYDREYVSVGLNTMLDDLRAAIAAMEGR